jgi:Zn-dependent peptidase ImmA (M78 family)
MSAVVARRRAEQLVTELDLKRPAIDVERVARHLGARVVPMRLSDASGLLITQPGVVPCIVVNQTEHEHRQRFTIAHELGHLVMKHHFQNTENVHVDRGHVISFRNDSSAAGTDPREIEANQFAAVLLMPAAIVKREAAKLAAGPLREDEVERLAKRFKVSVQAMTIRLNALGLL